MISWVLLIVEISTAKPKSCIILPNSREKELLNDYFHSRTFFFWGFGVKKSIEIPYWEAPGITYDLGGSGCDFRRFQGEFTGQT
jgi:hypothetical protein